MRDSTKVIIGFGSIWGLLAFGVMVWGSFTMGWDDSLPTRVAIVLYGLTILPSCILAIWFRKQAASWLIILALITAFEFIYQVRAKKNGDRSYGTIASSMVFSLIIASIPALVGALLFRAAQQDEQ